MNESKLGPGISAETMSEDGTEDYALKFVDQMKEAAMKMVAEFANLEAKEGAPADPGYPDR